MYNWNQRSNKKELLDRDDLPFDDIRQNMHELDTINRWLGGHAITVKGVAALTKGKLFQNPITILEIGCGGGDNLRAIGQWAQQKGVPIRLTGVDMNPACIAFAKSRAHNTGITFICADYKTVTLQQDIIFSSLFCHHFTDSELVPQLHWMRRYATHGFFINDLHRHPVAYAAITLLTQLFSNSYLVKADAPLSVKRGFIRRDWQQLFQKAMLPAVRVQWQWAFRWLLVYPTQ